MPSNTTSRTEFDPTSITPIWLSRCAPGSGRHDARHVALPAPVVAGHGQGPAAVPLPQVLHPGTRPVNRGVVIRPGGRPRFALGTRTRIVSRKAGRGGTDARGDGPRRAGSDRDLRSPATIRRSSPEILHDLRDARGAVAEAALPAIARALNLSRADVHGVVSFYHDFRRARRAAWSRGSAGPNPAGPWGARP